MAIFVYVHLLDLGLMLSVFESSHDPKRAQKISNTFDLSPEQAMLQHLVRARHPMPLGLSGIDSSGDRLDVGFTYTARSPQYRIALLPLCECQDAQVYAVCCTNTLVDYFSEGYDRYLLYSLDAIARLSRSFADADLFNTILPSLKDLEKTHVQSP